MKKIAQNEQEKLFGKRFVGASFTEMFLPAEFDEQIFSWLEENKNFLVLIGPTGIGKTYFCSAMVAFFVNRNEQRLKNEQRLTVFNERSLFCKIREHINSTGSGDYLKFIRLLIDDDFVIIDDLGSSSHTEWREEVLMDVVNCRYESMKPTVFTSNLSKKEFLKIYGPRITSRLFASENLVIDLHEMPDFRQFGE